MKKLSFSLLLLSSLFLSCLWEEKHDCTVRILVESPSPLPSKAYELHLHTKRSSCVYELDLGKRVLKMVGPFLPPELRVYEKGCSIYASWRDVEPPHAFGIIFWVDDHLGYERPNEMEVELREGSVIHSSHRLVFDYKPSLMWGKYPQEIACWNAKAPLTLHFP